VKEIPINLLSIPFQWFLSETVSQICLHIHFTLVKNAKGFNDEDYPMVFKKLESKKLVFLLEKTYNG